MEDYFLRLVSFVSQLNKVDRQMFPQPEETL